MYEAEVIHHIPGRMRIRAPFLKGAVDYGQQVKQLLLPIEGLKQVEFSPITGSVLLHYDPQLHEGFTGQLTKYVQRAMGMNLITSAANGAATSPDTSNGIVTSALGDTKLTREIYSFFNRINKDIKDATKDGVDLKSLLPIGLGLYALLRVGSAATTPLWVTLGIFSFTSFAILNPVSIAVGTEDKPVQTTRRRNTRQKISS